MEVAEDTKLTMWCLIGMCLLHGTDILVCASGRAETPLIVQNACLLLASHKVLLSFVRNSEVPSLSTAHSLGFFIMAPSTALLCMQRLHIFRLSSAALLHGEV